MTMKASDKPTFIGCSADPIVSNDKGIWKTDQRKVNTVKVDGYSCDEYLELLQNEEEGCPSLLGS